MLTANGVIEGIVATPIDHLVAVAVIFKFVIVQLRPITSLVTECPRFNVLSLNSTSAISNVLIMEKNLICIHVLVESWLDNMSSSERRRDCCLLA